MFRVQSRLRSRNLSKALGKWQATRQQSSQTSSGNPLAKVFIGAAGVTTLVSGVVGYGAYSNENRKSIEDLIPGSNFAFETLLGPTEEVRKIIDYKSVPKALRNENLKPKKSIKELEIEPLKDLITPVEVPPMDDLKTLLDISVEESSESKQDMIIITPSAEEKENNILTEALQQLQTDIGKSITDALSSAETAGSAIKAHSEQAFKAIDSADEKIFASISGYADAKSDMINKAEDKIKDVIGKIEMLKENVVAAVNSGKHKGHEELIASEEAIANFLFSVENIQNIIAQALNDSRVVGEFGELVDAGRKQFASEIRSLSPDVKLGETSEKLTTEELDLLLAHAHRKVINLQRLLAKHQVLKHDTFKQSIEVQRKDEEGLFDSKIQSQLDKQDRMLNIQFKQQLVSMHDEHEKELRSQLKRQAAAHSDHLSEVIVMQEKELDSKWQLKLMEEVQIERDQYHREISEMRGHVEGLNDALSSRVEIDNRAYSARQLWLACESLKTALKQTGDAGKSFEENLIPLADHIKAISLASEDNKFVETVLNAVPTQVSKRGVYNESALRERFMKVDRTAKKVAMVGDNGGSLVKYLLSYMQHFFIVNSFESMPINELKDSPVSVDNFNTYDILARARYCLDKDDLNQAVKYMNLLRGESRHVSSDWIKEARLTIETRLIAEVLLVHAAATAVTAL